jgi:uncharacterized protein YecE (DUF72 family)
MKLPYRLALPGWAFPDWKNRYFDNIPNALTSYSSVFNAVEGNTTFYQIPDSAKVIEWQNALNGQNFKMCLKLPQSVTHAPQPNWHDLDTFFTRIAPLKPLLGPLLIVLPASLGPDQMGRIQALFNALPTHYQYALEVRHMAFFHQPGLLEPLLQQYRIARVVLDSRPLYKGDQSHTAVANAKMEKPDLPVKPKVYNELAYVRLVMHPESPYNQGFIDQWAKMVSRYLEHNIEVYMTFHCPSKAHVPQFAWDFHQALMKHIDLPQLPSWPVPQQGALL